MAALAILVFLPACTTIHAVGGGSQPGEFYAVAQKSFLGLPGPSYVIRCKEISDPLGTDLACSRVLVSSEAGQLAPAANPTGRTKFTRISKP